MHCTDCGDEIPAARLKHSPDVTICVACQQDLEKSGGFVRSRIEVYQELQGWSLEGLNQVIIPGGKR